MKQILSILFAIFLTYSGEYGELKFKIKAHERDDKLNTEIKTDDFTFVKWFLEQFDNYIIEENKK